MRHYGVEQAFLFGSAARDNMNENSDIDFIIRFPDTMPPASYADNYFALANALETLLKKRVDLVTERTIKNPYLLQTINKDKLPLL